MKILLVNPPYHRLKGMREVYFPLGLGYLAAYIQQHKKTREVKLYNAENPSESESSKFLNYKKLIDTSEIFEANLAADDFLCWSELKQVVKNFEPDIVGITVMSCKYRPAIKVTEIVKSISKKIITVWGGPHCSAAGREALENNNCIDYIITNEGEPAFEALVNLIEENIQQVCYSSFLMNDTNGYQNRNFIPSLNGVQNLIYRENGKMRQNPRGTAIANLDDLPFPLRDADVFQKRYPHEELNTIMASRGCPYQCKFCDSRNVWGQTVRYRSCENILKEIEELKAKYGVEVVSFSDDTFTLNRKRAIEFCHAIAKSGLKLGWTCTTRLDALSDELCEVMKESGVILVTCGIESGSDRILKAIKKSIDVDKIRKGISLLEKHKIDWSGFFMVGFPMETMEDIEMTRRLWREIKPSSIVLNTFTPHPGSELCEEMKEMGLLPENPDWSSFSHQNLNNHFMVNVSRSDFEVIVRQMFEEVEKYNTSLLTLARKVYRRRRYYFKHFRLFASIVYKKIRYKVEEMNCV